MYQYQNGNAFVSLQNNGTRVIQYDEELQLEYPLNIDIRVSTSCSFGMNIKTNKAFCSFCHESAVVDGIDCNFEKLKEKLEFLPKGIELAIGCNQLSNSLYNFLYWCYDKEYVCNLTINQGHIKRDLFPIVSAINDGYVKGLGISYRSELNWNIPQVLLEYPNTVFHVIAGIDTFKEVEELAFKGVKKLLILGEKNFGFNLGNVDLNTRNHQEWYWWIHKLFKQFEVVSFDNLALEQLNIRRFFTEKNWNIFNQGEYSFYINAVEEIYSPSSRSNEKTNWDTVSIPQYFKQLTKC